MIIFNVGRVFLLNTPPARWRMSEPHRRAPVTEVLASVRLVPIPNARTTSLWFVLS
jgi:hypothetical protein